MKKDKKMNANWSYVELEDVTDVVTSVDGAEFEVQADTFVTDPNNNAVLDNTEAEYYPDLVFKYEVSEVVINGNIPVDVETLIAGHHPVARPK